ncbi:hypothetical protein AVEN_131943-1 [Araneus ventricosus]|uniref:DUF4817 domain-containing protein n=1 Tax=Araneus ventricosus TaxID=182803 RepID=A0A4Y2B208_ARAVE|nr:hypothetical protein AVEN_131943-1 [Araneus ventricosus]
MIPENATLFSIFLLGKGIREKTPCDVTACRREYLRTAPSSEEGLLSTGIALEYEGLWSSTRSASWQNRLYRERFPEGPHPTRQTILKVVKRLRETGCVTTRPRVHRPRNVGLKVQSEDVLAYALSHPQSSTKMMSENCGLSKSRVWTILKESGAHPCQEMLRDVTRGASL